MTVHDFLRQVFDVSAISPICRTPTVRGLSATAANVRIPLQDALFIDAFCNEVTGRMAYALIKDEKRIFGADNTGGWHLHPFDSPNSHEALEQPMMFEEFVRLVQERV